MALSGLSGIGASARAAIPRCVGGEQRGTVEVGALRLGRRPLWGRSFGGVAAGVSSEPWSPGPWTRQLLYDGEILLWMTLTAFFFFLVDFFLPSFSALAECAFLSLEGTVNPELSFRGGVTIHRAVGDSENAFSTNRS